MRIDSIQCHDIGINLITVGGTLCGNLTLLVISQTQSLKIHNVMYEGAMILNINTIIILVIIALRISKTDYMS